MSTWLPATDFASLAQISDRKARAALTRSLRKNKPWRGTRLTVRLAPGAGGPGGVRYEVELSSLPLALQEAWKALQSPVETAASLRDDRNNVGHWRHHIIAPALVHEKWSAARGEAVRKIVAERHTGPDGKPITITDRTIQRWLDAYEAKGIAGLMLRARRDKGTQRVVISARWDGAVPFDEEIKETIAEALKTYIRGLHKEATSAALIDTLAADKLRQLTAARCDYAPAMSVLTFKVPRPLIDAERQFRNVAIFKKDRKAYEDSRPRIFRTREGLAPMQIIVGDVHHLDICMMRPDGAVAWPKAIAWLDLATNRIWLDVVLLEKGEGIRNAHVIASFVHMVQSWGMPSVLYLDNGSEYSWADFMDDALKLMRDVYLTEDRDSQIVRAKPYNASAKAIEGIFRVLEYTYFRSLQGWAGGDRTNKKTAKVGHPTEPFTGGLDELRAQIGACLTLYHSKGQGGASGLGNRSPRQVYEAAVAAGWQKVTIDPRELRTVFATSEVRQVRQGAIQFGGQHWTCPELSTFMASKITVRVPKFEDDPTILPLLDDAGKLIGFAAPVTRYGILDKAGAAEADRIASEHRRAVRDLDKSVPDIDVAAEIARVAAALPTPAEAAVLGTISISDQAREIAVALAETSEDRADRQRAEAQKKRRIQSARMEKLALALQGNKQ
ncbi:hypothetical protein [Rhodopseudomonas palustris]|uniref:Integrase catalytic domain-containing protein n=1 Tax=Rhodopseudomonas palustris (strain BisB18) TaxID=316056 RepID=Q218Q9_RHOPB